MFSRESRVPKAVGPILALGPQAVAVKMGEFGAVKAYEEKADLLRPLLEDDNDRVAAFAKRELHSLELLVASESRRAQEQIAMRKLQYGEALDDGEAEDDEDSSDYNDAADTHLD